VARLFTIAAAALALVALAAPAVARADQGEVQHPPATRLFHAPTAWVQPHGGGHGAVGVSHRFDLFLELAGGLGDIAEIGIDVTDDFVYCGACAGDRAPEPVHAAAATFKLGVPAGAIGAWQPALALGFRRTVVAFGAARPDLARLYLAASMPAGPFRLHAGADLWDGIAEGHGPALHRAPLRDRARGFGGLDYRPGPYPRTAMIAELSFVPEIQQDGISLRWLAAGGVRYQALSWGGIELGVRVREGDDLGDVSVFVRLTGVLGPVF
jgi:hypothetical protein